MPVLLIVGPVGFASEMFPSRDRHMGAGLQSVD